MTPPAPAHGVPVADCDCQREVAALKAKLAEAEAQRDSKPPSDGAVIKAIGKNAVAVRWLGALMCAVVLGTVYALSYVDGRSIAAARAEIGSKATQAMVERVVATETRGRDTEIRYLREAVPRIERKIDDVLVRLSERAP